MKHYASAKGMPRPYEEDRIVDMRRDKSPKANVQVVPDKWGMRQVARRTWHRGEHITVYDNVTTFTHKLISHPKQ